MPNYCIITTSTTDSHILKTCPPPSLSGSLEPQWLSKDTVSLRFNTGWLPSETKLNLQIWICIIGMLSAYSRLCSKVEPGWDKLINPHPCITSSYPPPPGKKFTTLVLCCNKKQQSPSTILLSHISPHSLFLKWQKDISCLNHSFALSFKGGSRYAYSYEHATIQFRGTILSIWVVDREQFIPSLCRSTMVSSANRW